MGRLCCLLKACRRVSWLGGAVPSRPTCVWLLICGQTARDVGRTNVTLIVLAHPNPDGSTGGVAHAIAACHSLCLLCR
jgi:hypothetical protein